MEEDHATDHQEEVSKMLEQQKTMTINSLVNLLTLK